MSKKRRGARRARHSGRRPRVSAGDPRASEQQKSWRGRVVLVLAVVAVVVATTVVGLVNDGRQLVRPLEADDGEGTPAASASTPNIKGPTLQKSVPIAIRIKAIRTQCRLLSLGLKADGTVQAPPAKHSDQAGWYEASPTPGEPGPSVILGYKQRTPDMPKPVFRHLGKLSERDRIEVRRADKTVAVFVVDRVKTYAVGRFPTNEVYGPVDHAGLRLITANVPGHTPAAKERNVVVYASLLKSRAAA